MSNEDIDQGTTDVRDGADLVDPVPDLATEGDGHTGDDDDIGRSIDVLDDHDAAPIASEDDAPVDAAPARKRHQLDKGLLAACFVIAGGLMLIGWGLLTAQTGDDGVDRPEVIENISPVENALQVLQQETIVVDFDFGYEAELILDGVELEITRIGELDFDGLEPGQQVETPPTAVFDPGNSRIEFRPSEGAQIEELTEGRHTATVIYWRIDEGRENARSYTWSFDVI